MLGGWNFNWQRRFFVWEELFEDLKVTNAAALVSETEDRWFWRSENDAAFTVNSAYRLVSKLSNSVVLDTPWHGKFFNSIWKCLAPSKVVGFVWQLLHNRISTRWNFVTRCIIAAREDSLYPLCGVESETDFHLFLYCTVAKQVWIEVFAWLKVPFSFPHNLFSIFNCFLCAGDPKASKGRLMICCAAVWTIWKFRNSTVFDNGTGSIQFRKLVEGVKVTSWKWWLARTKTAHCLLLMADKTLFWYFTPCSVCFLFFFCTWFSLLCFPFVGFF
jgi:hypothetical protein